MLQRVWDSRLYKRFAGSTETIIESKEDKAPISEKTSHTVIIKLLKPLTTLQEVETWYEEARKKNVEHDSLSYKNISWEQIVEEIYETQSDFTSAFEEEDFATACNEIVLFADQLAGALEHLKFHYEKDKCGITVTALMEYKLKLSNLSEHIKDLVRAIDYLPSDITKEALITINSLKDYVIKSLIALGKKINKHDSKPSTPKPKAPKAEHIPLNYSLVSSGIKPINIAIDADKSGPSALRHNPYEP